LWLSEFQETLIMAWRRSKHGDHSYAPSCWLAAVLLGIVSIAGCGSGKPAGTKVAASPPTKISADEKATAPVPQQQPAAAPAPAAAPPQAAVPRGEALYAQHCAACHGDKGDGRGIAARFLYPQPRDFRAGRFRLISTDNNVPTIEDLEQVLVRGMPGSAMVSWAHLSEPDRKQLAEYVLKLRRDGARDLEIALAKEADETLSEEDLAAAVERVTTPGAVFTPEAAAPSTSESVQRGRDLFKSKGCAACHGDTGKGDGQQKMVDAEGIPTRPRDLTRGIFKGAPDYVSLYRRLWLGMPGSPMPGSKQLTPAEITDMVHFVLSLSEPAVREAPLLRRSTITVKRLEKLPASLSDAAWNDVPATSLTMTPLWWRDDADPDLAVQAVHDGRTVALRMSWRDDEADFHATRHESFEDAVAVELYRGDKEPFVGMGMAARDGQVDVWMWDGDRLKHTDVEQANPRMVVDHYPLTEGVVANAEFDRPGTKTSEQNKLSLPALAVGNPIVPSADGAAATSMTAGGPGSLTFRLPRNQLVDSEANHSDGRWQVMLSRVLQVPEEDAGISLAAGDRALIAIAVWDGSQADRNGQKLVTIWQDLVLEK
jgi:mono/diheme cytochrome c family protein